MDKRTSIPALLLLLVGGMLVGAVVVHYTLIVYGPQPPHPADKEIIEMVEDAETLIPTIKPTITPTPFQPESLSLPTALPVPTSTYETPLEWQGAHFHSGEKTVIKFSMNNSSEDVYSDPFYPFAWFDGIFDTPFFDPNKGGAVAWEDNEGRIILWVHSGPNNTVTPLQIYLERDEKGNTIHVSVTVARLFEHVIGASVVLVQNEKAFEGTVVAAVRIPPSEVLEMNDHVMSLPQILLDKNIGEGWQAIIDNPNSLILYFCGRRLAGEESNPVLPHYQQARFIIGVIPNEDSSQASP